MNLLFYILYLFDYPIYLSYQLYYRYNNVIVLLMTIIIIFYYILFYFRLITKKQLISKYTVYATVCLLTLNKNYFVVCVIFDYNLFLTRLI